VSKKITTETTVTTTVEETITTTVTTLEEDNDGNVKETTISETNTSVVPPKVVTSNKKTTTKTESEAPKVKTEENKLSTKVRTKKTAHTCNIVIYDDDTVEKKVNSKYVDRNVYEREVYWIQYFSDRNCEWAPRYICSNDKDRSVRMSYCGVPITKTNKPSDWERQLKEILEYLKKEGIEHNDVKKDEVLVMGEKIHLVDFGWMSKGKDFSCGGLFDKREKPDNRYRDSDAIARLKRELG